MFESLVMSTKKRTLRVERIVKKRALTFTITQEIIDFRQVDLENKLK